MHDILIPSLIAAFSITVLVTAVYGWLRRLSQGHTEQRRLQGYRLIHSLQAYSAWIDYQRDLPFTALSLDELTSPEPLTQARHIKNIWFPMLSQHMVRLLQAHSRMIEYLWQQNLLRLTQGAAWQPAYEDRQYQQLRGAQEDLIDEMVHVCREQIGDTEVAWRRTGSDFVFSSSFGMTGQGSAGGA
jgi:hypothetical protein